MPDEKDKFVALRDAAQAMSGQRRQIENTLALIAAGEAVGNIGQAILDLEGRRNVAARDAEQAKDRLREVEDRLLEAKKELKEAKAEVSKAKEEATAAATEIKAQARQEGAKLTATAMDRKKALDEELVAHQGWLNELNGTIDERRKELAELDKKIADTKAEALKRFGA